MGNRILTLVVILIVSLFSFACSDWFDDEDFSQTKEEYNGDEIRLDGYYYNYYGQGSDSASVTIFYKNGVVIDGVGGHTLLEFESNFTNGTFYNNIKNYKDVWGIYRVENNEILIERITAVGGWLHRIAFTDYGEILNDTTICFFKHKESHKDIFSNMNDTLHFKQFSPKPDSTNVFIK